MHEYGELVSGFQPCRWYPGQCPDKDEAGRLRPRLRTLGKPALIVALWSFVLCVWEAPLLLKEIVGTVAWSLETHYPRVLIVGVGPSRHGQGRPIPRT